MKEKDLKHSLQQIFHFSIWKEILSIFFKKIDYLSHPENLFTENGKVIDGRQIGTVRLDDGKQLAIFTVEVANNISIVRNRQGLREIAAKHIDQNIIHGALAFFYNKNQADYRFSFIAKEASLDLETGELKKDETKPKRYTYLLGANEACNTPAKRMLVLADKKEKGEINIKELKEVFSVEALNKDFFKTYKAHYEKFWKYLAEDENPFRAKLIDAEKETKDQQEKPIRDFVKKLLGRIVFLQFLEKKGWMGVPVSDESGARTNEWVNGDARFLYNLFGNCPAKEQFHSKYLTTLFFKTLNTKRENDLAPKELTHNSSPNTHNFKIPYLNGGLFEPEKNKATLEVDFPTDYFKELLEFFDQYNFTIDENSPDDHEVGIDPEMLGHIFENLLEDNRDKGAFYTPKEIVQYMCKESLIQYLLNTFREEKDIEDFIRSHTVYSFLADKENAILLNQKLDNIKVCDPAIGSGAFPIGMLQEIFEAKRFIYPYLKTNQDFKPADVKKNIIQNSIYGVDLEKGAVDIAQLRFWLSLVVEELNPHPLPNLDYKIMQGNSLLESFEGVDLSKIGKIKSDVRIVEPERDLFGNIRDGQMKMTFTNTENINKIQKLVNKFFRIEDAEDKRAIRGEINDLVLKHIEYNIELRENQVNRFISEAGNPDNLKTAARRKYNTYVADLNEVQETKTKLLKIQSTDERPYFLWHLYFMDIFEQGGFDVIIGNPPYLRIQGIREVDSAFADQLIKTFKSASGSFDLYAVFVEKSLDLINDNGIVNFIMPTKWTHAAFGSGLREIMSGKLAANKIINFGAYQVFNASTYTGLQWFKPNSIELLYFELDRDLRSNNELAQYLQTLKLADGTSISKEKITKEGWTLNTGGKSQIIDKLNLQPRRIRDIFDVFVGLQTSKDDVYFLYDCSVEKNTVTGFSKQLNKSIEIEKSFVKPLLKGEDVHRYEKIKTNRFVVFPYKLVNGNAELYKEEEIKSEFPLAYSYLKESEDVLRDREKGRLKHDNFWYRYIYPKNLTLFATEKLMAPEISLGGNFSYDENGRFYSTTKVYGYIKKDTIKESYLFWLALFNSKLFWYFIQQTGYVLRGGYFTFKTNYILPFPVPETITAEVCSKIEKLVKNILENKKIFPQRPTLNEEKEIDEIIYK